MESLGVSLDEAQEALDIKCIRAIRAWKDTGYPGEALNDSDVPDGISVEEISPETSGFTAWERSTGNSSAYRDPDGALRGTATLARPLFESSPPDKAILYLHGGGYRKYKPTDGYALAISTRLALHCSAPVLAIDYRLAPEFDVASRAAINDVMDAMKWLEARFTKARLFIIGDSAGAGLALAYMLACVELRDLCAVPSNSSVQPLPPAGIVMLSPYIDLTMTSKGFETAMFRYDDAFGDIFYSNHDGSSCAESDREWLRNRAKDYYASTAPDDPYCSPMYTSDALLREFPPILALVGGHEVFSYETSLFASRAQRLGVKCSLHIIPRMWHDWFNFCELPSKIGASKSKLQPAVMTYDMIFAWMQGLQKSETDSAE